jgi:hypothetical protein
MTEYQLKRKAITTFKTYTVEKHVKRYYQRQWLLSVQTLGDKWRGLPQVKRLEQPFQY